jgi:Four helix bundle sensory module for signal transduction
VPVQLRIGPKLMLALAGLLAATVMVSGVAVAGLGAVDARTQELYQHNILTTQAIAELQATLDDAAGSALQLLLSEGTADRSRLLADLRGRIVPRVDEKIAVLQKTYGADPDADPARLERLSEGWGDVKRLIRSGLDPRDEAQKQAMTRQVVAAVDPISTLVAEMAATEMEHARESQEGPRRPAGPPAGGSSASRPRPRWSGWSSRCC